MATLAFVHVLLTAMITYVSTLPQTGATGTVVVLKQRPQASELGGLTPTEWSKFSGCTQCACRQEESLVDCSGKMMNNGRLPGTGSLPRNDIQIL